MDILNFIFISFVIEIMTYALHQSHYLLKEFLFYSFLCFIAGCDSGFGNILAQRLDDLGLHVFAGCLHPEKEGAQTLKKSCSERLHVVYLNVLSAESIEHAVQYVSENLKDNSNFFLCCLNTNTPMKVSSIFRWFVLKIITVVISLNLLNTEKLFIFKLKNIILKRKNDSAKLVLLLFYFYIFYLNF